MAQKLPEDHAHLLGRYSSHLKAVAIDGLFCGRNLRRWRPFARMQNLRKKPPAPSIRKRMHEPMMPVSAEQRSALVMLATAGRDGVAQALLSARGFDATMTADLVNRGLATLTMEKVLTSGKLIAVAMVRITEAGRRVLD
jgi:hypothetical protein